MIYVFMPTPITLLFLLFIASLATLHALALALFLYWQVWWFDIPMHLFGGMTVALGFFAGVDLRIIPASGVHSLTRMLIPVAGIAVGWEVFQHVITSVPKEDYVIDTSTDIVLGLVGATIGYYVVRRLQENVF
jgi:hypothetical protein